MAKRAVSLISSFLGAPVSEAGLGSVFAAAPAPKATALPAAPVAAAPLPTSPHGLNPAELYSLLGPSRAGDGIGFTIRDAWLGAAACGRIREEVEALDGEGKLRPAGMGRDDTLWASPSHRGDRILWLSSLLTTTRDAGQDLPPGLRGFVNSALEVHAQLKHACPGLLLNDRISIQVACYVRGVAMWLRLCVRRMAL